MTNVVTPGLAVTYIRSTGEQAPATIIGRSTRGEDFIHLKYMRNGHELEHHAPFVFEGKLCFTKDIVDDSFVPRNRKPKPTPKPAAKPAPKGKQLQLFKMRRKVGKGFYSTAPDAPDGQ